MFTESILATHTCGWTLYCFCQVHFLGKMDLDYTVEGPTILVCVIKGSEDKLTSTKNVPKVCKTGSNQSKCLKLQIAMTDKEPSVFVNIFHTKFS